jgi:hypothetical protein
MHRAKGENFEMPPKPIPLTEEDIKKINKARKIKRAKARKMKEEFDKIDFSEINRRNTVWMREKGYRVDHSLMENGLAHIVMNGKVKETVLSLL